jgi:hypothetical protein
MVGRGILVVLLSVVLFAIVFIIVGLVWLILTGNLERAALIGGVCGFAVAWLTNTAYIIGQQSGGETHSEVSNAKDDLSDNAKRRLK